MAIKEDTRVFALILKIPPLTLWKPLTSNSRWIFTVKVYVWSAGSPCRGVCIYDVLSIDNKKLFNEIRPHTLSSQKSAWKFACKFSEVTTSSL